jgi:TP901 family phage tail tape measure protein
MQRFIKPSKEAQKVAASFGIELTSHALASKGLSGALTEMVEKTNGSKEALAAILGDARAIRGAFVLAKNGGQQFNEELALMQSAAGATDTALSYQEQGLAFQLQILSNNFTAMAIEVGEAVIPELIKCSMPSGNRFFQLLVQLRTQSRQMLSLCLERFLACLARLSVSW